MYTLVTASVILQSLECNFILMYLLYVYKMILDIEKTFSWKTLTIFEAKNDILQKKKYDTFQHNQMSLNQEGEQYKTPIIWSMNFNL